MVGHESMSFEMGGYHNRYFVLPHQSGGVSMCATLRFRSFPLQAPLLGEQAPQPAVPTCASCQRSSAPPHHTPPRHRRLPGAPSSSDAAPTRGVCKEAPATPATPRGSWRPVWCVVGSGGSARVVVFCVAVWGAGGGRGPAGAGGNVRGWTSGADGVGLAAATTRTARPRRRRRQGAHVRPPPPPRRRRHPHRRRRRRRVHHRPHLRRPKQLPRRRRLPRCRLRRWRRPPGGRRATTRRRPLTVLPLRPLPPPPLLLDRPGRHPAAPGGAPSGRPLRLRQLHLAAAAVAVAVAVVVPT